MEESRRGSRQFGDLQIAILRVLWQREEATVEEICDDLAPEHDVAYSTVSTVLSRLLDQEVVSRRKEGRRFVYRAELAEDEVRGSMVKELLERAFGGDPARLVGHLLRRDELGDADLDRLRELIEERKG